MRQTPPGLFRCRTAPNLPLMLACSVGVISPAQAFVRGTPSPQKCASHGRIPSVQVQGHFDTYYKAITLRDSQSYRKFHQGKVRV